MCSVFVINICLVFVFLATLAHGQTQCTSPSGNPGLCVSILDCPALRSQLLDRNRSPQQTQLLQDSRCGGTARIPNVCCPNDTTTATVTGTDTLDDRYDSGLSGAALLPKDCGRVLVDPNRIFGGTETAIGEYPWMALIEYRNKQFNDIRPYCGGALINPKYILTAAHCILIDLTRTGPPLQVRLGEHDTRTKVDCRRADGGGEECNDAPVVVAVGGSFSHPQYSKTDVRRRNDVGLLRLQRKVTFTDFIQPICLPSSDAVSSIPAAENLFVAGWGQTELLTRSPVKLEIAVKRVDPQRCQEAYSGPKYGVQLWEKQVCAGGDEGVDSCGGDSGGPLMYKSKQGQKGWEAIGVVSFGPTECGQKGIPGIYTKVIDYRPWIVSQLKA